jgi:hypothetical protein
MASGYDASLIGEAIRRAPALRVVSFLPSLPVHSWLEVWRAAGIPHNQRGMRMGYPLIVITKIDLQTGSLKAVNFEYPFRRIDGSVLRDEARSDYDGKAARLAARAGCARALQSCPRWAFRQQRTMNGYTPAHEATITGQTECLRICGRIAPETFLMQDNKATTLRRCRTPALLAAMWERDDCLSICGQVAPDSLATQDERGWMPKHWQEYTKGQFKFL